jgi:hypothetical protein
MELNDDSEEDFFTLYTGISAYEKYVKTLKPNNNDFSYEEIIILCKNNVIGDLLICSCDYNEPYIFYNNICDLVSEYSNDDVQSVERLIRYGYYYNRNTLKIAKKSDNIGCSILLEEYISNNHTNMDNWGPIQLNKIDCSRDFWALINELHDDMSDFVYNKDNILDAYVEGNLYGLSVSETDEMYKNRENNNPIFVQDASLYLLPCFCIVNNDIAIIIWTHTRARRKGFAKKLVELLNIKYASNPLPGSEQFWFACNVAEKKYLG